MSGTLQVTANSTINSDQTGASGSANADIWLLSTVSGSGNLTLAQDTTTNGVFLFGNNSAYTGNWTNSGGFMQIGSGTTNALGSGNVKLVNVGNSLIFNSTNNMIVTNLISGAGSVTKQNTNTVILGANNTYTGTLADQGGLLVLAGSGAETSANVSTNGLLLIANSAALPNPSTLTVSPNNAQTGGVQLSNSVTLATGNAISVAQRTGPTVAIESVGGNNAISDAISIFSGGTSFIGIQADAGTTLALNSGITCSVTGARGVLLEGAGSGSVAGVIDNGSATTVSLTKDGTGTWTLNNANTYYGNTVVTNGVLKLGASASITSTVVIEVDTAGKLDATLPGGLLLGSSQLLRGSGVVLGNVATSAGSIIQVGITNQYGQQLSLSNSLVLAGSDTIQYNFTTSPNNVLNVAGALTLNGTTTIQIFLPTGVAGNGTNRLINYSGTLLGGGSFSLVAPVTSQTFTLDISTPGQVNLIVTGVPQNLVWSGDGSGNVWDVATTANWTGQYFHQGDNVTFNDSGSATPDINVSVAVSPGTVTVSNTAEAYTFDGSGISTTATLDKRGNNVLALTSSGNNFSGPVIIEAGTLSLGNGGSTGSLGTGSVTNNGQLLLNLSSSGISVGGAISGTGTVRLTGGGGSLALTASNSYTGLTTIENGCQLNILNNNALGSTNTGTVVQAGGSVRFTSLGNWTVAEPLTINGYGLATSAGALYANTPNNQATWTGPITVASPSQIRIVNTNVTMTLANSVIGNQQTLQCSEVNTGDILTFQNTFSLGNDPVLAALTNDGVGTIVLAGNSNLCGSVIVNGGTFEITTTNAPQLGNITVNTGTLQLGSGLANGSMPAGAISLIGSTTKLAINSSNTFALNNQLNGAGSVSLINYGTLTINFSNTFAGNVTTGSGTPVFGGTIVLSNSFGLGDGTASKTVTLIHASLQLEGGLDIPSAISFATSSGNTLADTNAGVTQVIRNLSGTNIIEGSITPTSGAGNSEYTVSSGLLTLNGTVSPNITNRTVILSGAGNGVLNGALNDNGANIPALTKQGTGKWTLNNANVYSGVTVVQNGTLALGASATIASTPSIQLLNNAALDVSAISGGFTLGASQTLAGIGNVLGSFNATGTVSPGPLGTLTFSSNLTLSGTTLMELNRTNVQNADLISASTLAFGGTLTVTNLGDALLAGDSFQLFSGTISGTFAATNLPALSSTNLYWDTSQLNSGVIKVAANTAPTPTITSPGISGTDFTLQVTASQSGFNYVLQATPTLAPAAWTGVQTNAGTGGTLNFSFPITPANPQQFFRISVQ
jgi:autotransporter-associated beta strand protein